MTDTGEIWIHSRLEQMATFPNRLLHQGIQSLQLCLNKLQHMIYIVNITEEIHDSYNGNHITTLLKTLWELPEQLLYTCANLQIILGGKALSGKLFIFFSALLLLSYFLLNSFKGGLQYI